MFGDFGLLLGFVKWSSVKDIETFQSIYLFIGQSTSDQ